jgi:drug/metabolite transporter (DMT)-like permease
VLAATVYALLAAFMHAGWNLIAKRAVDPFLALWGQFIVAGVIGVAGVALSGGVPAAAWVSAAASGLIHVPYVTGLAHAYRHGDFSLAYPIARGGGALIAAIGGIVLLDDDVSLGAMAAIVVIVGGLATLGFGAPRRQVATALGVAATIGGYTLIDSHAVREFSGIGYVFATHAAGGFTITAVGVARGRSHELLAMTGDFWRRTSLAAVLSVVTYGLVLFAVRRAPVGYVSALRESSVLIAAVVGWRVLGERGGTSRTVAATFITLGLVGLVAAR